MDNRAICIILLVASAMAILIPIGYYFINEPSEFDIVNSREVSMYCLDTDSKINGTILLEGDSNIRHVVISLHFSLPDLDTSPILITSSIKPQNQFFCGTYNSEPDIASKYDPYTILFASQKHYLLEYSEGNLLYEFDIDTKTLDKYVLRIIFGTHIEAGTSYEKAVAIEYCFYLEGY